jgi:hypothetical protein
MLLIRRGHLYGGAKVTSIRVAAIEHVAAAAISVGDLAGHTYEEHAAKRKPVICLFEAFKTIGAELSCPILNSLKSKFCIAPFKPRHPAIGFVI